ncbi:MAG: Xaa-Pro peptidase family protein [Aigarchaeota archaeon]|nr:Xaa-Pro peptidase family protein [Aigarchaeota archaeon]MDW8021799.1 Xaa-Pro peptidase family protein [Nitrososphaerota archaeon]
MANTGNRLRRLMDLMKESGLTGFLLKSPANIFYFTGYIGPGILVVSPDGIPSLFVYPMDYELAEQSISDDIELSRLEQTSTIKDVINALPEHVKIKMGFDELSAEEYFKIKDIVGGSISPASECVWRLRMVKNEEEVEKIRRSCNITSECMGLAAELLEEGVMESEVKAEVIKEMFKLGAERAAFEIIVASGPKSSLPHGGPEDRSMKEGDVVVVDLGVVYDGYCSDMTRTFYIGSHPDEEVLRVHDVVMNAKISAQRELTTGITAASLYEKAYGEISSRGYGDYFIHGLGHGVGIEIHEPPRLSPLGKEVMEEGMVVTIEPGIYLPRRFGVRIEDTMLVKRGGVEILTSAPYELIPP